MYGYDAEEKRKGRGATTSRNARMMTGIGFRRYAILRCVKIKNLGNMGPASSTPSANAIRPMPMSGVPPITPSCTGPTTAGASSMPERSAPLRRSAATRFTGWSTSSAHPPKMQRENDRLRSALQAYPELVDDLQSRLDVAVKRAKQAEATNERLNTLIPTIAIGNCKYAHEKGLDEAEMLARTTQAVNRKVAEMEERARRPRPPHKQEPRTLASEEQVQERKTAPVEEVRLE